MNRPSAPPTWRKIAAALRGFFKPEPKRPTAQAPPAPDRALTEQQQALFVAEFRAEVIRAVEQHKAKAAKGGEPADAGELLAGLSKWIDAFVKWKLPDASLVERRPLNERLQSELAGMVAAAWWPKPAQPPAPEPVRPSAKAMSVRIERSPEEQRRIDALNAGLGQSLADGLNAAVALIDEKRGRHSIHCEFYDVHGIPVTINDRKVPYCCRWDCAPVSAIEESYVRIAGRRIEYEEWEDLRRRMRAAWEQGRDRVKKERHAASVGPGGPYSVESYDIYDAPSERRPLKHGAFATAAEALAAAQALIDRQLLDGIAGGRTAAQALDQWRHFGEIPIILGPASVGLDPFAYAARRATELAAVKDDPDGARFRRFMARATELPADGDQLRLFP